MYVCMYVCTAGARLRIETHTCELFVPQRVDKANVAWCAPRRVPRRASGCPPVTPTGRLYAVFVEPIIAHSSE